MGAQLYIQEQMQNPVNFLFPGLKLACFTAPMPSGDGNNGDSIGFLNLGEKGYVCLLADGAGGTPGGNQASGKIVKYISDFLCKNSNSQTPVRDLILTSIEEANNEIISKKTGAATTLCVVEIVNNKFRTYHIGDSSIILVGNKGKIILKTISHSPHGYAIEAGLMDEDDIPTDLQVTEVSNLVGNGDMRIELGIDQSIKKNDTLLLCTDGITDNIGLEEITDLIRKGPLNKAANGLQKRAQIRMASNEEGTKPDDFSFLLCRLTKKTSE